jgi:glycosyltransferase involved in cell wall biosynthesis
VELCATPARDVEFLWVVPEISWKHNSFAKPESRATLKEPAFVPHLRTYGIPYVVGNISKFNLLSNYLLFRDIFRRNRIDAVFTHFGFERFWATLLGKLWGKVTIWNEHWHSLGMRYGFAKRLFYRIFVDEFISISNFIAGTLPRGCRVHTIINAIRSDPPSRLTEQQALDLRKRLGVGERDQIVLMVAQFTPQKRHFLALEICRKVLAARPNVFFIFLGKGSTRIPFLEKARELGLQQRIVAPGYVSDVGSYYSVADFCLLTSHNEGFGYAVLEAMRYSLPVIAFDSGGPAEVIRNGETGILVKDADVDGFADRVVELIDNRELRVAIGERAHKAIQDEFSRDVWIRKLTAALEDIVVRHRVEQGLSG